MLYQKLFSIGKMLIVDIDSKIKYFPGDDIAPELSRDLMVKANC
jgi:hypothetical protein